MGNTESHQQVWDELKEKMLRVDKHYTDFVKLHDGVTKQGRCLKTSLHVTCQSEDRYKLEQVIQAVQKLIYSVEELFSAKKDIVTENIIQLLHFLREKHADYFPSNPTCNFQLDIYSKEHQKLTESVHYFNEREREELEKTIKTFKTKIFLVEERLKANRSVEDLLRKELDKLRERIKNQQDLEASLVSQQHKLFLTLTEKENVIMTTRSKIEEITGSLKTKDIQIEHLIAENQRLEVETKVIYQNNQTLAEQVKKSEQLLEKIKMKEKAYEIENEHVRLYTENVDLELSHAHSIIKTLREENEKLKLENESLSEKSAAENKLMEENNAKYRRIQDDYDIEHQKRLQLERHITDSEEQLKQLRFEHNAATNKLDILQGRKTLYVQLYSAERNPTLTKLEADIMAMLKDKLERKDLQIEFVQCTKHSDIQPGMLVLLMCILVSCLKTDVDKTIHGLTLTRQMALLIFHHKGMHALPTSSSEDVLTRTEFRDLGGIFDMVFYTGTGFHNCKMNTTSSVSLVNFIKREGEEKLVK